MNFDKEFPSLKGKRSFRCYFGYEPHYDYGSEEEYNNDEDGDPKQIVIDQNDVVECCVDKQRVLNALQGIRGRKNVHSSDIHLELMKELGL